MSKIILTVDQLKKILERPDTEAHYPITISLKRVSKAQLEELVELLKKKKG
ncbi:hypothetical protein ABH942_003320 [Flavobacterium sp. 28YEA47A]|uniref:hypothetical protein n=1 Tax=Flavobacterium sp. 28YEA47A TaxID=3156276 RepID=UPI00351586CB